jgi:hypothetical protein
LIKEALKKFMMTIKRSELPTSSRSGKTSVIVEALMKEFQRSLIKIENDIYARKAGIDSDTQVVEEKKLVYMNNENKKE